ncbi:neutral zinc metallopeptidase [Congregibacter variabilis]|uniref:Neutral zinc metallopeptidase n=1 Tax=Congregibacter variabilis TaxID=3081200 RepID=A0ABZ0I6Q5_9GAMM|nr:neutral zinc metallopeptidase [Congregibacter sp. IMCC43200]
MRWKGNRRSDNIDDRRGRRIQRSGGSQRSMVPLIMQLSRSRGGWMVIVIAAGLMFFTGTDLKTLLGLMGNEAPPSASVPVEQSAQEAQTVDFMATVLADTEDTWAVLLAKGPNPYVEPKLVLYRDSTRSACGLGQSAMGPFYCPADKKIYLDLSFFEELSRRYGAPGDFAQAYVLAHEVGHHVQTLLGISARTHAARQRASEVEANRLSVRQELQADCFAGLWANHADRARQILETGDVEEALAAATAIGDDTLQRQAQGRVTPDSFTHGSAEQRLRWFMVGLEQGSLNSCDTFNATVL